MELAILHFGESADGDLAPAPEAVEQSALAGGRGAGVGIVQECQQFAGLRITFADFDSERSLSRSGAHDFGGNDLFDQFGFAETL